jgi:hypothetical protein
MTDANTRSGYRSYYILNREYFSECFDESANTAISLKTFRQTVALIILAGVAFALKIEPYVVWFLLCLIGVELLSIRYKRSWWITRQMLSRSAGSKVNIRIDEQGIFSDSAYHQQAILWQDITQLRSTEKGFVIDHNSGTHYLSRNGLTEYVLALIATNKKIT